MLSSTQCKNLFRHRADPSSSYSALVTHIASKLGLDASNDPPLHTPKMGLQQKAQMFTISVKPLHCMNKN